MSLEPPARIAILGAGPIGLEAALYARFLGYEVDVFERGGGVAENVRGWGHVRMFSPFSMNASPLGLAAIEAQEPSWKRPADDELLTGQEFVDRYLAHLARTDLVAGTVHVNTRIVAVGRGGVLKGERNSRTGRQPVREAMDPVLEEATGWKPIPRDESPFCILTRDAGGGERMWTADAVIDATGTYGNHNWLGPGGIPAIGELAATEHIEYGLPDVLGRHRDHYAGQHTLLVGGGYSAATSLVALAELAAHAPGTRVTWLTRGMAAAGPIPLIPSDRLAARRQLAESANRLAHDERGVVTHLAAAAVERIAYDSSCQQFHVAITGAETCELVVDRVIANIGYRPDLDLCRELQVHTCYASEGPMKLAAALLRQEGVDCLDQRACGPESLVSPEPNFFILGSKSYGRLSTFLLPVGREQIREAFTLLGDNPELNLYRSIAYRRP